MNLSKSKIFTDKRKEMPYLQYSLHGNFQRAFAPFCSVQDLCNYSSIKASALQWRLTSAEERDRHRLLPRNFGVLADNLCVSASL